MLCTIPGCFVLLAAPIITSPICAKHLKNGPYCNTQDALCYGDGEENITLLICMVSTFLRAELILAQHKCGSCASQCKSVHCGRQTGHSQFQVLLLCAYLLPSTIQPIDWHSFHISAGRVGTCPAHMWNLCQLSKNHFCNFNTVKVTNIV